jgi:uncharacterized Zn finger protein
MGRWGRDFDYPRFPPSTPIAAKGGIKAQSKRGAFGETWWAKRWISVLEGFQIGARLGRGRAYARSGQVLSIEVEKGEVTAEVQGSRPKPYQVHIRVKPLTEAQWRRLGAVLSREALFAAKLLAGEMPRDIEQAFGEAGLSLFPERAGDLATECSCPDWSNPCKHIAAVYYLLGEEFDRDPFLLFRLRGLKRQELAALLEEGGGLQAKAEPAAGEPPAPLAADPEVFWNGGQIGEGLFGEVRISGSPAALLRRLGNFPFWRGEKPLLEALEPAYRAAAARGLEVFAGGAATAPAPEKEPGETRPRRRNRRS